MKVSDLMKPKMNKYGLEDSKILQSNRVIALDGKDGKILFDTYKNKSAYIEKYMSAEVISIWASNKERGSYCGYSGTYFQPCTMLYLSHDSWQKKEENE